jgi:ribonuclease T2
MSRRETAQMQTAWRGVAALALAALIAFPTNGEARSRGQHGSGGEPGQFDYYALALSWSPTYCESRGPRGDGGPQCNGPRPFAFVLHGLWPQYTRGWPQNCQTGERPWVPQETIDEMIDIMPSKRLIIHEYQKHGTCSGLSPDAYFDTARKLYSTIKIPERYQRLEQPLTVSPGEVVKDFTAANPELKPEMIAVSCDRRLKELRICFGRDLKPQACGGNETARKLCTNDNMVLPPVRPGRN